MHYYKRNLGDYAKKAGRLTMLQHGAFNLLIDACYDRERFPTLEEAIDWAWASSPAEKEAVEFVLSKFFTVENGVYVQNRIAEEVAAYHAVIATNTRIAKEREDKRTERERTVNASLQKENEAPPNQEPLTINQEPRTINHKPVTKVKPTVAALPDWLNVEVWEAFKNHRGKKFTINSQILTIKNLSEFRDQGQDPTRILETSIANGWKGVFAEKQNGYVGTAKVNPWDGAK
jgi:uncharacterized protein YdaU (DUF1376 family)